MSKQLLFFMVIITSKCSEQYVQIGPDIFCGILRFPDIPLESFCDHPNGSPDGNPPPLKFLHSHPPDAQGTGTVPAVTASADLEGPAESDPDFGVIVNSDLEVPSSEALNQLANPAPSAVVARPGKIRQAMATRVASSQALNAIPEANSGPSNAAAGAPAQAHDPMAPVGSAVPRQPAAAATAATEVMRRPAAAAAVLRRPAAAVLRRPAAAAPPAAAPAAAAPAPHAPPAAAPAPGANAAALLDAIIAVAPPAAPGGPPIRYGPGLTRQRAPLFTRPHLSLGQLGCAKCRDNTNCGCATCRRELGWALWRFEGSQPVWAPQTEVDAPDDYQLR